MLSLAAACSDWASGKRCTYHRDKKDASENELMNNRVLWYFFVSSVWVFIALNGYKLISHAIKAESIFSA